MEFSKSNAQNIYNEELAKFNEFKTLGLKLDMSRGKPNKKQLDLSNGLLDVLNSSSDCTGKIDYRNYGLLDGIPEAKELFANLFDVSQDEIIIMGNSSLNIMYDTVQRAMQFGVCGEKPLNYQGEIKWLCPVPGYDRHFAVTEAFGIKMIPVKMNSDGPDMDQIEELVKDEQVKGIWCVPKFSNPQGIVYSDEVVTRFAKLKPAAKDFRIYWDNAYAIHYVFEDVKLLNLLEEAKKYGNEDLVYMFGSTSKCTFAGAGVAWVCASVNNVKDILKHLTFQTIGYNKINQLAHVRFFKTAENLKLHMAKHAELLKPKFTAVLDKLDANVKEICHWDIPKGGYFISIDLPNGTAKRVVSLCKEAGVVMTGAGSTYPYKQDPNDSNLRIAPSLPSVEELDKAMDVFTCCIKLAWAELNK